MNELVKAASFYFERLHNFRAMETKSKTWFVAADICKILGIKNPRKAVADIPENEKMTVTNSYGHSGHRGGAQFLNIINEAGLYRLVFKSRKPEAKRFQTWVFEEVLPSIRKHGIYRASLPKIWPHRGKELTHTEFINEKYETYIRYHPDADFDEFLATLPF